MQLQLVHSILLCVFLILVACAPSRDLQQAPIEVVERVMIQCWNGAIVESVELCPSQEIMQDVAEPISPAEIVPESVAPAAVEEKSLVKRLIETAPENYWYVEETSPDSGAIVMGSKRSIGKYRPEFSNMFWDTKTWELYVFAVEMEEDWWNNYKKGTKLRVYSSGLERKYLPAFFKFKLTGNRNKDDMILPIEVFKWYGREDVSRPTNAIEMVYVKSPVDWLMEYQNDVPIKIDDSRQTLKLLGRDVSSNLSIHFKHHEKPGATIVFRIEDEFHLPLIIEEYRDYAHIGRRKFVFDKLWYDESGLKVRIADELVSLPKNYIVITWDDWKEYERVLDI